MNEANSVSSAFSQWLVQALRDGKGRHKPTHKTALRWTHSTFHDALGKADLQVSIDTVRGWFNGKRVAKEEQVRAILDVLLPKPRGTEALAEQQAKLRLWQQERGPVAPAVTPPPADSAWLITPPENTAGLTDLRLHPLRPANLPGTHYLDATLRVDEAEYEYEGQTLLISLREAFLGLSPASMPAVQGSFIGERIPHDHITPKPTNGVLITGPREPQTGKLRGDILGGEHVAVLVDGGGADVEVQLTLAAGTRAFIVEIADSQAAEMRCPDEPSVDKQAVLEALIAKKLGRDEQGRILLARARARLKPTEPT